MDLINSRGLTEVVERRRKRRLLVEVGCYRMVGVNDFDVVVVMDYGG